MSLENPRLSFYAYSGHLTGERQAMGALGR